MRRTNIWMLCILVALLAAGGAAAVLLWETSMQRGAMSGRLDFVSGSDGLTVDAAVHTALSVTIVFPRSVRQTSNSSDAAKWDRIMQRARRHSQKRRNVTMADGSYVVGLIILSRNAGIFPVIRGVRRVGVVGTTTRAAAKKGYLVNEFLLVELVGVQNGYRGVGGSLQRLHRRGFVAVLGAAPAAAAAIFFPPQRSGPNHAPPGDHAMLVLGQAETLARTTSQLRQVVFLQPFFANLRPSLFTVAAAAVFFAPSTMSVLRGQVIVDASCPYLVLAGSAYDAIVAALCAAVAPDEQRLCAVDAEWTGSDALGSLLGIQSSISLFLRQQFASGSESELLGSDVPRGLVRWEVPLRFLVQPCLDCARPHSAWAHNVRSAAAYFGPLLTGDRSEAPSPMSQVTVLGAPVIAAAPVVLVPTPSAAHGFASVGLVMEQPLPPSEGRLLLAPLPGAGATLIVSATAVCAFYAVMQLHRRRFVLKRT
jgi:hypothetical protein